MTNEQPLEPVKRALDVFVGVTLFLFLMSALVFLIWGTPASLQRVGAFWIAFVLISFGFIKLVVSGINEASRGRGQFAAEFEEKIGPLLKAPAPRNFTLLGQRFAPDEERYSAEEVQAFLDDLENHVSYSVVPNDIMIVGLATLLTGFGDLLFCVFRSMGHPLCSS